MHYYNNKKFGLLQFHSGYGKFYLNSPKIYSKKNNAQTASMNLKNCLSHIPRSYEAPQDVRKFDVNISIGVLL